jgi:hypothetical protein
VDEIKTCPNPHCGQKNRVPPNARRETARCSRCKTWLFMNVPATVGEQGQPVRFAPPELTPEDITSFSGQPRPVHQPSSRVLLARVEYHCAVFEKPFSVIYAQERPHEKFHIVSLNGDDYQGLLGRAGYTVNTIPYDYLDFDKVDHTGFQCFHCGHGLLTGKPYNSYYCFDHDLWWCMGRSQIIQHGMVKVFLPCCGGWNILSGLKQGAEASFTLTDRDGNHNRQGRGGVLGKALQFLKRGK